MMKMTVTKASCKVRFRKFLGGSVLKGTVDSGCKEVETHLEVESDDAPERVLGGGVLPRIVRGDLAEGEREALAGIGAGVGFIAKGPVTWLLPGMVVILYALVNGVITSLYVRRERRLAAQEQRSAVDA